MRYAERALTPHQAKLLLEGLAEGIVEVNRSIIDGSPDDYPCCCGCGDFKLVPQRAVPLSAAARTLVCRGPDGLVKTQGGNAFELACFQCAQRRREGDEEAHVAVDQDPDGYLRCVVIRHDGEDEDMAKYAPQRNCVGEACGCLPEA